MSQFHDWVHENWNRYYDPVVGQYLSIDPILKSTPSVMNSASEGVALASFAYAENNPIAKGDPDGNWSVKVQCEGVEVKGGPYEGLFPSCSECRGARELENEFCAAKLQFQCDCAKKLADNICTRAFTWGQCDKKKEMPPLKVPHSDPAPMACLP